MNRLIATRVVDTGGAITNTLINREATEVWWITISAQAINTQGLIQIYDGFDTGGRLVWQFEPAYSRQQCFCPPIHCGQGAFVYTDANIASYTIAYRPKKWNRPRTHPLDIIEPPKAEE